jgi:5,10-methylenetetrahydromethanopterin reductase
MIDIDVSVALPPSFESAAHIATAEQLGYRAAYLYDTPFEGDDVWLDLHRAAEATTTIELRHLHIHQGHMVEMNDADLAAWRAGGHVTVASVTMSGSADTVAKTVSAMAEAGATEIVIEPSGPDIARELAAFMSAVRGEGR